MRHVLDRAFDWAKENPLLAFGLLYGLLSAEDYALLMGSLLLFAVLAAVMVLTRRLDWYGVGRKDFPAVPARA